MKRDSPRTYESLEGQFFVTFEMNLDMNTMRFTSYSLFDFISQIGGLATALTTGCTAVVLVLQFRALHLYLSTHLFAISFDKIAKERFKKEKPPATGGSLGQNFQTRMSTALGGLLGKTV